jgi:mRNA interferase HigB
VTAAVDVDAGADKVGKFTVFNIGGNKARLITAIHYNTSRVCIRYASDD